MQQNQGEPNTLKELAQVRAERMAQAKGGKNGDEATPSLPSGQSASEGAQEETPAQAQAQGEGSEAAAAGEAASDSSDGNNPAVPAAAASGDEPEEEIRIGDQVFKSQKEAFAYAEKIAYEKQVSDAYNQGIRDHITATTPPPPPEEDKFEEQFYTDPKGTLKKVKEEATQEALALIRREQAEQNFWDNFQSQYPDIRLKDAQLIYMGNQKVLGHLTIEQGMKRLAQLARAEYEEIEMLRKPRQELPKKGGQVVSAGGAAPASVTPSKKDEKPLTLTQQLKKLRGQG